MNDRTDHVLEAIDSALGDPLSSDAMRWTPNAADQPRETDTWERVTVTRADLISSGDLIEAPAHLAQGEGWSCPVALTRDAHADAVAWTQDNPLQDEEGRWRDVLMLGAIAARAGGTERIFKVSRVLNRPGAWEPLETYLVVRVGPGDHGETVVTITTPQEKH